MSMSKISEPDYFDPLPDALLMHIFNRIGDFKTLCRCCSVSKRFDNLVTQVDNVVVMVIFTTTPTPTSGNQPFLSTLIRIIVESAVRPVELLGSMLNFRELRVSHTFNPVLKRFSEVRVLKIEFPSGNYLGFDGDKGFMKWSAEFEPTLSKYVFLAATSVVSREKPLREGFCITTRDAKVLNMFVPGIGEMVIEPFAKFVRTHLLGMIAEENSKLDSLVVTDVNRGGVFRMTNLQELAAFSETEFLSKTYMRANYADKVCLTNGNVLVGVVLAYAWPLKQDESFLCDLADAFEEPYDRAVSNLISAGDPMVSHSQLFRLI